MHDDRARVLGIDGVSVTTLRIFELLPRHPIITVAAVTTLADVTKPTAGKVIDQLVAAGVLRETSGRQRDRECVYESYLRILRSDTDLR